jgi:transposase
MNTYLTKLIMYHEIHRMKREGYSISKISRTVCLDRRTVKHYLSMSEAGFDEFMESQSERKKELLPYESFIKLRLEKYPDTSSAQMHDWLKEHFGDLPVKSAKTIFNFVSWVRIKYHLPKLSPSRQYEVVEELPYGKQAQVDFGEYNLRGSQGKRVKVFFFTMVLSRSRYKFVWFTDKYFTSELAIEAHEKAFVYMTGIPDEIVYDQDKVFIVDENHGDIILTEGFKAYTRERSFNLYFCKKSDPESKGKVENVVKYTKQNFLYNRAFEDIETLNAQALAWLLRTANMLPHNTTKKQPIVEWEKERPFLAPYTSLVIKPQQVTHTVRKDNTISWKSNYYSLPAGTYKGKGSVVVVKSDAVHLIVSDLEGTEVCSHLLAIGKGQTIKNTDHTRDKKPLIDEMIDQVCLLLVNPMLGRQFLNIIRQAKPRYIRDQILIFKKVIENAEQSIIEKALEYCSTNNIASAADFKAIVLRYTTPVPAEVGAKILQMNPLSGAVPAASLIKPDQSSIEDYQSIIKPKNLK